METRPHWRVGGEGFICPHRRRAGLPRGRTRSGRPEPGLWLEEAGSALLPRPLDTALEQPEGRAAGRGCAAAGRFRASSHEAKALG